MTSKRTVAWTICALLLTLFVVPSYTQDRGKAELKAGTGKIIIDYGRPVLKGRDMLSQLKVGDSWRMGTNTATSITTPVDLMFSGTKIAKGSYSLFLKRVEADKYELTFNSQTGQWGTVHDPAKDVAKVALKKESIPTAVETFTIELREAPKGGTFALSWGMTKLSADFELGN